MERKDKVCVMVEWKVRSSSKVLSLGLLLVTSWSRYEQNFLCEISQRKEDSHLRKIKSYTNFIGWNTLFTADHETLSL